ncbi:MAG: thrombospondin type 3 repeat-containing protein, partial [Verrucomicrobiota bacterium]
DGDGMNDGQELLAGTDPLSSGSLLQLLQFEESSNNNMLIQWSSEPGRFYTLERATNLQLQFSPIATNLPATPPVNVHTDVIENIKAIFYRIIVRP